MDDIIDALHAPMAIHTLMHRGRELEVRIAIVNDEIVSAVFIEGVYDDSFCYEIIPFADNSSDYIRSLALSSTLAERVKSIKRHLAGLP